MQSGLVKSLFLLFLSICLISACSKDEVQNVNVVFDPSNAVKLASGVFENGAHSTSGKVTVWKMNNNVNVLSFENLSFESGPDLRIYIAEDKKALNYTELVASPKSGTFHFDLPNGIDYTKKKFILIWCKQYSVLFGSAELK